MSTTSASARAYAAWVTICVVWGTTYLAIRIALETIPPMLMAGMRWTAAGAVLLAGFTVSGEPLPALRAWPMLTLLGVLLIGFGNGGVVWAEQTLPSGSTALLVATVPFWMIGVEWLAGTLERLTLRRVSGLVIGFLGILVLVWPELRLDAGQAVPLAVAATQLACLGWALGSTIARRRAAKENVLVAASVQMLCGGLVMLVLGLLGGESAHLAFSARSGGALAYLVVFGSVAGFSAYAYALKHLPVATVSLYAYVNPVIAVVLGTVIASEPWSPRLVAAGAAVLLGMALVKQ